MLAKSKNGGGGNLGNKGFAVSGMIYPILILILFLIAQILYTLNSRKEILEREKNQLLDSINRDNKVYTLEEVTTILNQYREEIDKLKEEQKDALKNVYPVGSIYISTKNENPKNIYGGTWVAFGTGRTLVGVNTGDTNFNAVEKTGGASTVSLTTANLPAHNHTVTAKGTVSSTFTGKTVTTNTTGSHVHGQNVGAGGGNLSMNLDHSSYTANQGRAVLQGVNTESAGNHSHTVTADGTVSSTFTGSSVTTSSTGNGTSITNLQPYITVYMWKRTS